MLIGSSSIEISAFGSPFSHDICSCTGEIPLHFRWVFDQRSSSGVEVYMDYGIHLAGNSQSKYKYLWMCESKTIVPEQYKFIKNNFCSLGNTFRKIFVHDESLLLLDPIFDYVPAAANFTWIKDRRIFQKRKLVSMISSGKGFTDGHRFRNAYMQKLMVTSQWIDFFGRDFRPFKNKEEPLADYMFSITMENEAYSNYYTEKLMDCFATGTIPVYHGTPMLEKMFNTDGVIVLTEDFDPKLLSQDLYLSKRDAILDNFERCLNHKKADDFLYERIIADIG